MANQRGIVAGWDTENARPKGVTTAADLRASLSGICADEGIFWMPNWEPTRSETSMVVGLPAFTCAIESSLGGYYCPTIEPMNLQLPVGHASYDRYATFWVKQHDYQTDASHPDSEVETGVALGEAASVPAKPDVPAGALAAVTVLVPKGATNASEIPAENIQPYWTMSPAATVSNIIIVNGVAYQTRGSFTQPPIGAGEWASYGGVKNKNFDPAGLPAVPPGYQRMFYGTTPAGANPISVLTVSDTRYCVLNFSTVEEAYPKKIVWQLI